MNKVFVRSTLENGGLECSWYNFKGKRYRHEITYLKFGDLSTKQTDDKYGFMAYAVVKNFIIVDDFPLPHPKTYKAI